MINEIIQKIRGRQRLLVKANQRVLVIEEGKIKEMIGPGIHWVKAKLTEFVTFDVAQAKFSSPYAHILFAKHPDIVEANFIEVSPNENEIALVESYGQIVDVVLPDQRSVLWKDAAEWKIETISISESSELPRELAKRLHRTNQTSHISTVEVRDGFVGLLALDGVFEKQLMPGTYWFWNLMRKHEVKLIDLRWQNHEVNGQEVLTQDRVTIRVNLNATYRVVDPLLATQSVKDFLEAMHNALQLAFRKTIAAITLDKMLAERAEIDKATSSGIKSEMKKIGIELGEISLKDVILPGEMRDILNQVVTAQKEAEANVIRRREETNATRSLLNTAKVMADNPVMIRLKELEALEQLSGKIGSLTVHSGTQGLLDEIVKLRE